MEKRREVRVFKYITKKEEGRTYQERVFHYTATFHQFGCDYEEFETGAGNYSTAIVELPDGSINNVPVGMVAFKQELSDDT